ncbi:lysophospholipase [Candidatus Moduliflexus flocculans]|uniref:Lysophospholipase n=1 Tax=Candidatus Moduliflexus flocculans TaxID=1499966 RepID=A0A081BP38_9BACT|nr:lysophospholipase [Candidatus Moduliflexus flocculans]
MEKEIYIPSFDGTRLFLKVNIPATPQAIIVIVHGLCEHLGRYAYLTQKLTDRNFGVYRFDHRGHGKSEGTPIFYHDFHEMIDDVHAVVALAKKEHPTLPVFLIGHSMGGLAVTTFGIKYPNAVKGIVASGAVTRFNRAFPIPPNQPADSYFPNELANAISSDPAVVEAYKNDPLVAKQVSFGLFYCLFAAVDWNKQHSSKFVDAVLLLHGCHDELASEKDSREFFGDISSKDKTLKIYAFLFHEIFNEPSKDEVIGDVISWLEKRV